MDNQFWRTLMEADFEEIITTQERLREITGEPSHQISSKVIDHVDEICAKYIAASPYLLVASRGADGLLDQSPKGDAAGFVHVLNSKTLIVPDRFGNKRVDTFENLLVHPEIALFFIIPDHTFTLRVSGKGKIVRDRSLQAQFAVNDREPNLLMAVTVEEAFLHCAKSIARANLWKPEKWPDISEVPSLAEGMVAHGKLSNSVTEMQSMIDKDYETRMY
jgi:PPOX class probable FMN-dependent enzyme